MFAKLQTQALVCVAVLGGPPALAGAEGPELLSSIRVENAPHLLAFSPDDRLLASASGKVVTIWSLASSKPLKSLAPAENIFQFRSISFSPDGKLLLTASGLHSTYFWDTGTWKQLFELPGYPSAFSGDGKMIATSGPGGPHDPGRVRFWETTTQKERASLPGLKNQKFDNNALAVSPDSKHLAVAYVSNRLNGDRLKLWDINQQKEIASAEVETSALAFSPDGKWLVSNSFSGFATRQSGLFFWDAATLRRETIFDAEEGLGYELFFNRDGKIVYQAKGGVRFLDPFTRKKEIVVQQQGKFWIGFSPSGRRLAVSSEDAKVIKVFEIKDTN